MTKYRKKPVVIDAFRFGIDNMPEWFMVDDRVKWMNSKDIASPFQHEYESMRCEIQTREGVVCGKYGDYIIKGVKGEIYPCEAEIFNRTYESI